MASMYGNILRWTLAVAALALPLASAQTAHAGSVTIYKQQSARVWAGGSPTTRSSWNGNTYADIVGDTVPYYTPRIVMSLDTTAGSATLGQLEIKIFTNFGQVYDASNPTAGGDCFGSTCAYAADISLKLGTASGSFTNYGISLGAHNASGRNGLAQGFYQTSSWLTSQNVWGGNSGFLYGGEWENCGSGSSSTGNYSSAGCSDSGGLQQANTVIKTGTAVSGTTTTETSSYTGQDAGDYIDVKIAGFSNLLTAAGYNQFQIFWGTGDCDNDPIYGQGLLSTTTGVQAVGIPAPASLALVAGGLAVVAGLQRRKVR